MTDGRLVALGASVEELLGEEYAAIHDAAMAEPLEETLREGSVFVEATQS